MPGLKDSDVLNDELFIKIASEIKGVTPEQLSDYLGFKGLQGYNAKIVSSAQINPTSPYVKLLRQFVSNPDYGKDIESALKLRLVFLEKDMVPCAEIIEKALRNYGRNFPSRADTLIGLPSNLRSPPHHTPELEKTEIVNPIRADTPTRQDVNAPSPPHDKPGSETPMDTHGHGPQPPDRPVEQETPSNSDTNPSYLIVIAGIVAIFSIVYIFVKRR
ncbi:uncharacterized protein LOC105439121 [Strongylocentrotus purpuratus]|uniref:Uncharacterized protein n=1 Tax=Strongylocentrotus purpuratus TaxID=7668 RepID=A0A7M7N976_STRPU|nr:uncharacterized protein LOC105439121 [Strongylocentrotus purpuratus]